MGFPLFFVGKAHLPASSLCGKNHARRAVCTADTPACTRYRCGEKSRQKS